MPPTTSFSLEELIAEVNAWSASNHLTPANGQSADLLSLRTVRYYRTMGLLAAPSSGGGQGYGEMHRLQLSAIRLLQVQGLPLRRIQTLLYGRSETELRKVVEKGIAFAPKETPSAFSAGEDWRVVPLDPAVLLILRNGRSLTPDQLSRINAIINHSSPDETSSKFQQK